MTLTLGGETVGIANEYIFQFTSGDNATTLTMPNNLVYDSGSTFVPESNTTYQISILKGYVSVLEWKQPSTVQSIFPMYLYTENEVLRPADEQTIALADYILENTVSDNIASCNCIIPSGCLYIDDHEVYQFYSMSKTTTDPYTWSFVDGYDYGYFSYWSDFYVDGPNKGKMNRYDAH